MMIFNFVFLFFISKLIFNRNYFHNIISLEYIFKSLFKKMGILLMKIVNYFRNSYKYEVIRKLFAVFLILKIFLMFSNTFVIFYFYIYKKYFEDWIK